jgi:hypothetical protein
MAETHADMVGYDDAWYVSSAQPCRGVLVLEHRNLLNGEN